MNQISPQELFPIVYVLANPTDTNTYFVRSVMRNSATGVVLGTYTLTNNGNRRFTKNIQAPNDPSEQGFWIDIVTTVYNDAGFTSKETGYAEQTDKYLVQSRWNFAQGGGGGLGGLSVNGASVKENIDYLKIKQALQEAMTELPTTDIPEFDLTPVTTQLTRLETKIEAIDMPKDNTSDIKDAIAKIGDLITAEIKAMKFIDFKPVMDKIDGIELPKAPETTDYSPQLDEIKKLITNISQMMPEQSPFLELVDQVAKNVFNKDFKFKDKPDVTKSKDRINRLMP